MVGELGIAGEGGLKTPSLEKFIRRTFNSTQQLCIHMCACEYTTCVVDPQIWVDDTPSGKERRDEQVENYLLER